MIKDVLKYLEPNACVPIDMETTIMLVNTLKEALAQRTGQEHMTPWSQKTIEQKIEASIRHYTKEIERAKEVGDPHQFVGTYEGFVVCLESILEKNI